MTDRTAALSSVRVLRDALLAMAVIVGGAAPLSAQDVRVGNPYGAGVVFTANQTGNSLSVVDPRTQHVATTPLTVSPHNVQASSDGETILVVGSPAGASHATPAKMVGPGRLVLFAAATVSRGPIADIEVGRMPAHVIVDGAGTRAFVTNGGDSTISVIDLARREIVKSIPVGASPHGLRMSPNGRMVYVANTGDGTVSVVSVEDMVETARIPVGKGPVQVAFTPDGRRSYVTLRDENSTAVIDTASRQVIAKVPVGPGPIQVFAAPSGQEVYVANQGTKAAPGNTVSVIDTLSQAVVTEVVTGAGAHGVVVSSNGDRIFITNSFADTMSVIDTATRKVVRSIPVGTGPGGITFVPAKQ